MLTVNKCLGKRTNIYKKNYQDNESVNERVINEYEKIKAKKKLSKEPGKQHEIIIGRNMGGGERLKINTI